MLSHFLPLVAIISVASANIWSYHGACGPSCWSSHFPDCGKNSQSPIDLTRDFTGGKGGKVNFYHYDKISRQSHFHNNGHSDQDEADDIGDSKMFGGPLDGDYKLIQLHFHWGANDSLGSEHTINGQRFPLEMHLVNKHATKPNNLAVAGFLFTISPNDNPNMKGITDNLKSIREAETAIEVQSFSVKDLISAASQGPYFNYRGSLTTPPCSEIVNWLVFDTKIPISSAQLQQFRLTKGDDGISESDNFRPTQARNGRVVNYVNQ